MKTFQAYNLHVSVHVANTLYPGGKGEVEAHGVDHWTSVGERLNAEKHLAEEAKKVSHRLLKDGFLLRCWLGLNRLTETTRHSNVSPCMMTM